jgi:hypothetical protein
MRRRSGSLFHRYPKPKENNKGFVTLRGLAIYIKKSIFNATKEQLWKFKYFTMQKYNLQKKPP